MIIVSIATAIFTRILIFVLFKSFLMTKSSSWFWLSCPKIITSTLSALSLKKRWVRPNSSKNPLNSVFLEWFINLNLIFWFSWSLSNSSPKSNLRLNIPLSGSFGNWAFTVLPHKTMLPCLTLKLATVVVNIPLSLILSCEPPAVSTISFGLVISILSSVEINLMTFAQSLQWHHLALVTPLCLLRHKH